MKKSGGIISLIVITILIALLGFAAAAGFGKSDLGAVKNMNLGLDLKGGVSITYQVKGEKLSREDMKDTIVRLQRRAREYNAEASVYQDGNNRICIEIPGIEDAGEAAAKVIQPGALYFIREKDSEGRENYSLNASEKYELNKTVKELQEEGSIFLTAGQIADAQAIAIELDSGDVNNTVRLFFTEEGAETLRQVTKAAYEAKETVAIYYDSELISVPSVNAEVKRGEAQIAGNLTWKQTEELAASIRGSISGLELEELSFHSFGRQIGEDAISMGLKAGAAGLAIVILFMCLVFRLQGLASGISILAYTGLTFILINTFGVVLTLPGIAGIILGMGMSADANVMVFAGIKQERAEGKPIIEALSSGFQRARPALLDRNIVIFIAAAVLWLKGGDTVKAFAQVLVISIIISLFTTLVITRRVVYALYVIGFQDKKFYGRIKVQRKSFNFLGKKRVLFGIPITLALIGFVIMGINGSHGADALNYGVEFRGGTCTAVTFDKNYSFEEIGKNIVPLIENITGDNNVHVQKTEDTKRVVFRTKLLTLDERKAFNKAMADNFQVKEDQITSENISPVTSSEIRHNVVITVLIFTACMLLYVWFRLRDIRFVICTGLTLLHNILLVLAFCAVSRISADSMFIACMLIIAGCSINAAIIIFERIREEMKARREGEKFPVLVNRCIAGTVGRNFYTSIVILITMAALYILGADSMKAISLLLMVGVICVIYSSMCITAPLWYESRVKRDIVKKREET